MNRVSLLLFSFLLITGSAFAKIPQVAGDWLIYKVIIDKDVKEPYLPVSFEEDGKFLVMGVDAGTWKFGEKQKSVIIDCSEMFKNFNGDNLIIESGKKELVLENNSTRIFFKRIDREKILAENKNSGLAGTWRFETVDYPGMIRMMIFEDPDKVTYIEKEPGVQSKGSGTWIFNKDDNELYIIGQIEGIRGKNKITEFDGEVLTLENKGETIVLKKEKQEKNKIERLTFTEDDFYTDDGDYKYENDNEKLPEKWLNPYEMSSYLQTVSQLTYSYSELIEGTNNFDTKTLTAIVAADPESETVNIDNIFKGYDRTTKPEDSEFPSNEVNLNENYNNLYPIEEPDFRVAGKDSITTPAGTFECTVIEAVNTFDEKRKLWMIDDKPGVYAKVIVDKPGDFGHYAVFELKEIGGK